MKGRCVGSSTITRPATIVVIVTVRTVHMIRFCAGSVAGMDIIGASFRYTGIREKRQGIPPACHLSEIIFRCRIT